MSGRPTLVVLTPVRNEAWILDLFLAVCSRFADRIVIADQGSTDGSREIAARWPKATVIDNPSAEFNEDERQKLLIAAGRELAPGPRVFLTLDADELVTADSVGSADWEAFLRAAPGTVLMLEKADLLPDGRTCLRYDDPFPYGYVDDGAEHQPRWIHSYRVPVRPESPRFVPQGIKLLHYARVQPKAERIKNCMYAMLENRKVPLRFRSTLVRRRNYGRKRKPTDAGRPAPLPDAWLRGWREQGLPVGIPADTEETWKTWACLGMMAEAGERRFWGDDIWDVDWERLRLRAVALGIPGVPARPLRRPPALLRGFLDLADAAAWRIRG